MSVGASKVISVALTLVAVYPVGYPANKTVTVPSGMLDPVIEIAVSPLAIDWAFSSSTTSTLGPVLMAA